MAGSGVELWRDFNRGGATPPAREVITGVRSGGGECGVSQLRRVLGILLSLVLVLDPGPVQTPRSPPSPRPVRRRALNGTPRLCFPSVRLPFYLFVLG